MLVQLFVFVVIAGLFLHYVLARLASKDDINHIKPDCVFAFDLHGVVLRTNVWQLIKKMFKIRNKLKLIRVALNPKIIAEGMRLIWTRTAPEKALGKLSAIDQRLVRHLPEIMDALNSQRLDVQTAEVLIWLKQAGHKLFVLSNIGEHGYRTLSHLFPKTFELFDGVHFCSWHNNYASKPNPAVFTNFIERFGLDPQKVVFIDDRTKNLTSARSVGMKTIWYQSGRQLMRKLAKIGAF